MTRFNDSSTPLLATMGAKSWAISSSALLQDIFVIEPDTFLIVELGTGLGTLGDIESLDKLLQGEHLLLRARIPA